MTLGGGWAASYTSGPICLALGVSRDIGGGVGAAAIVETGAWVGTTLGGMGGEYMGEKVYEVTQP